jgi:hypothetical protein
VESWFRAWCLLAVVGTTPACHLVFGHTPGAVDVAPDTSLPDRPIGLEHRDARDAAIDAPSELAIAKPDAPRPDAPKLDAPKPDAPKPDAPKPDGPKKDLSGPDKGILCATATGDEVCTNGWCWQHPRPQGNTLHAITRIGSTRFAVGLRGTILRDQGQGWKPMSSGTTVDLYGVHGLATNAVYAVGATGTVRFWNGSSWNAFEPAPPASVVSTLRAVRKVGIELVAVGDGGLTLRFDGSKWNQAPAGTANLHAVWGDGVSDTVLVGGDSGLHRLLAGSWVPESPPAGTPSMKVRGLMGSPPAIYAVGVGGAAWRFNGSTWAEESSGTPNDLEDVAAAGSTVIAAGYSVVTERSATGTWTASSPPTRPLFGVDLDGTVATVVGWYGTIAQRESGSWSPNGERFRHLHAVWGNGTVWFAVGDDGTVLRRSAGVWQLQTSGTPVSLRGVWGAAPNDVYAVGDSGTILHYNGTSWTSMVSGRSEPLHGIVGTSASELFVVGGSGTTGLVLRRSGAGAWLPVHSTSQPLKAVSASAPTNVVVVGTAGIARRWDGSKWISLPSVGENLVSVSTRGPNDTWALVAWSGAAGAAKVHHFTGGTSWASTILPAAPLSAKAILATNTEVLVVGEGGYAASNLGGSWNTRDLGTSHGINALWPAGPFITAVGDGGGILQRCSP